MSPAAARSIYLPPWRVDLAVREDVTSPVSATALARAVAETVAAAGAPRPASIGLVLADDRELSELNMTHLGQHGPTDVLAFPLLPPEAYPPHTGAKPRSGSASAASAGTAGAAHAVAAAAAFPLPPGARPHLGDIVVSVERAVDQARGGRGGWTGDVRWSPADELRLLVTHGALHLCGWDHAEPAEEAAMRAFEARLLGRAARLLGREAPR